MVKTDYPYLMHILDAIHAIDDYVENREWVVFQKNRMLQDAVIRHIQIIGEATKSISPELKKKHHELPWSKMAGIRDKLVHRYFDVDHYLLWQTAVIEVPKLENDLKHVVKTIE